MEPRASPSRLSRPVPLLLLFSLTALPIDAFILLLLLLRFCTYASRNTLWHSGPDNSEREQEPSPLLPPFHATLLPHTSSFFWSSAFLLSLPCILSALAFVLQALDDRSQQPRSVSERPRCYCIRVGVHGLSSIQMGSSHVSRCSLTCCSFILQRSRHQKLGRILVNDVRMRNPTLANPPPPPRVTPSPLLVGADSPSIRVQQSPLRRVRPRDAYVAHSLGTSNHA